MDLQTIHDAPEPFGPEGSRHEFLILGLSMFRTSCRNIGSVLEWVRGARPLNWTQENEGMDTHRSGFEWMVGNSELTP